jgi:hypothetical protein
MPQGKDLILIGSANPNVTSSINIPILFKALLNSTPVPSNNLFAKILAYYNTATVAMPLDAVSFPRYTWLFAAYSSATRSREPSGSV